MRIAHQTGRNTRKTRRSGLGVLLVLLIIAPLTIVRAQEPVGPVEVSAAAVEAQGGALVVDLALSRPVTVRSFSLTSPDRLVFDIEDAVLSLPADAATSWSAPLTGVTSLEITQFSTQPPVVRVAAEVTDNSLRSDRMSTANGLKLAVFEGDSPFGETAPIEPPEQMVPTIERFLHEALADGRDRFVIDFSFGVVLPQLKIESPTVLLLRFPRTDIILPATSPTNYAADVPGNLVRLMRAERIGSGSEVSTEIRLTVPNTSAIGYTLETSSEDSLELVLFSEPTQPQAPVIEPAPVPVPSPVPVEGGQMMVLASGDDVPAAPDAPIKIQRVQFQTIDGATDRFFVYYEGPEPEPRVQRFNYPTRIALYIPDAAVVLPESAEGRFESTVSGVVASELKAINRVIEDVGPETEFIFYFPDYEQENVGFTIEYVDPGLMHIDFYRATMPLEIENPVELNTSIEGAAPAPVEVETSPPPVVEESPPPQVEETVPETPAVAETPAPAVETPPVESQPAPEPQAPALPLLVVSSAEADDNVVTFVITSSEAISQPEWVEYHYPERIGLRFQLCDVQILDAGSGVFSAYTHIRAVPLIRAIIKDREEEKYTTIAFTLAGKVEEYARQIARNGNETRLTLTYVPTAPVEVPVVAEPIVETPAPPVEVEEPVPPVVEEPLPIEQPAEEVEEPAPVVEETPTVEQPEVEVPGVPVAPGEPPFIAPPALPKIDVTLDSATDNLITFRITTSEPLPVPEWIEFRYPDRLGLRFPIADVTLLGESGTFTASTHNLNVPTVRTMVKDDPNDKYTTIAFTLGGSLDEFNGQLDWNGCEMKATFKYEPVVVETPAIPEIVEAPTVSAPPPAPEETPQVAEVEVEAAEEPAPQPVVEPVAEVSEQEPVEEIEVTALPENEPGPEVVEEISVESVPQPVKIAEAEVPEETGTFEPFEEVPVTGYTETATEEWLQSFTGVMVTDVVFEKVGGADVLSLTTDKPLDQWSVLPVNYPTKLQVRLENTIPSAPNGVMLRFDRRVEGNLVDQFTANGAVMDARSFTTLNIYAHGLDTTDALDYDVLVGDNEWAIAVFPKGEASPFAAGEAPVRIIEDREAAVSEGTPEPKPVSEIVQPSPEGEKVGAEEVVQNQPKLSMKLADANIRDVLQLISEKAGLNISIGPTVRGNITISLTEVPLFDLLDLLGAQLNFTYFVRSGVYIFGESAALQQEFGNVWPRWYISLSYADPDQVRSILVQMKVLANDQVIVYRGTMGVAGGTNIAGSVLILQGEDTDLKRAYQIIAAVDQPPVMVQVDFQILNTSITDNKNLGFQFNIGTGTGQTNIYFNEKGSENRNSGPFPQGFERLNLGPGANAYSINYVINYLVQEGYAELENRSSLTVANNQTGTLFIGESIPYRSTYQVSDLGRVTQRVATQSVGLTLNFRPHANPDGTVTMYLTPTNSNLMELTDIGPRTVNQNFTTTVRVNDGEPFIIGGFIRNEARVNYDRFPFLSELPLLGHLFRNREVINTRSELIFVFTPHIIRPNRNVPAIWTDEDIEVPLPVSGARY